MSYTLCDEKFFYFCGMDAITLTCNRVAFPFGACVSQIEE